MKHSISFIHISEKNLTFEGISDAIEYDLIKFKFKFKLSFIVITLHVWTYSGTRCRASQDHGATLNIQHKVKQYKPIHN